MPVYLAIDYGTKRIGLAVSRVGLAEPLCIIENGASSLDEIRGIIEDEKVDIVVVGLSEKEMAEKTKIFAAELKKTIVLPVFFADETLSSKAVHNKLKDFKKKVRSGHIDHFAAAHFLQEWLDTEA